jgi:hypothetical protein
LAAGVLTFTPLVWSTAVVAEVFALNCLFAAGLIALSVWAAAEPRRRHWLLLLSMFCLGLGLSNHPTLVFFGAPFGIFVLYLGRQRLGDPRFLLSLIGAFALGLLPYFYLPIASATHPPVTWGDQTSVHGFLTHVLRREYGTFKLSAHNTGTGSGFVLSRLGSFWQRIGSMTFWIGPLLFLAGVLSLSRPNAMRSVAVLWLGALLLYLFAFNALANLGMQLPVQASIQERFWQQALVVVAAMIGVGLVEIGRRLRPVIARPIEPLTAIALPTVLIATNFSAMNHRNDHLINDYGRAILESLPHDSLLLIEGDTSLGIVRYLQQIEGMRRDVRVIPTGLLQTPWLRHWVSRDLPGVTIPPKREAPDAPETYSYQELIDANISRFPIFLINQDTRLKTIKEGYTAWPMGLVDQLLPSNRLPDLATWVGRQEQVLQHFDAAAAV